MREICTYGSVRGIEDTANSHYDILEQYKVEKRGGCRGSVYSTVIMQNKETLIGYNSKKQSYIFLIVAIIIFIIGILCFVFAEGEKKYASIGCIVVGILFLVCFIHLQKLPEVALKIIDDKEIYFYEKDRVKVIDLYSVIEVKYWPAQIGLKITFVTHENGEHFTYLLKNSKQVKKHILNLLEKYNIPIKKKYNRTY